MKKVQVIIIVNDKINFTKSYKETLIVHLAQPMRETLYQRHFSAWTGTGKTHGFLVPRRIVHDDGIF